MEEILTIWYRKAEVSYSRPYSLITYTPRKYGKLSEAWLPSLFMKWKSLNLCLPEHKETTVCLLGRTEGQEEGRVEGQAERWTDGRTDSPSQTVADHKEWELKPHDHRILTSKWECFSRGTHTAADSHPPSKGRPQFSSEKAVLRVISEQIWFLSTAGISSLSSSPPYSMIKHIYWG